MRWLARALGFQFRAPPPLPSIPRVPEPLTPPPETPQPPPLAGGFPMPPVKKIQDEHEAWKANLDHFHAHLETQRISIERFKSLIDYDKMQIEGRKLTFEAEKLNRQWYLDSSKATYEYGRYAINCILILNGGAALAVFQHLGAAKDEASRVPLHLLGTPLFVLAGGLVAAALTAAIAYLSQSAFTADRNRFGVALQVSAIASWFVSLGCFVYAAAVLARLMAVH